jgi:site-specific DNA-methyltransferase (adenine-specific)
MKRDDWTIHEGDALGAYDSWATPDCIISDGAYGVGGFHGDPRTPDGLAEWYRPHIEAWSAHAKYSTTLWFWNTEIGWANVHPMLIENGWEYVETIHWDKGIAHVAGNVNSKTIRRFPVANEICVFYQRRLQFPVEGGYQHAKNLMLAEWKRTGLPLRRANEACGVRDAAVRKYLDQGWLWYPAPVEMMDKLVEYANEYGDPEGRPYFSLDGPQPITGKEWGDMRYSWTHVHGFTNVWQLGALHGKERVKGTGKSQAPRVHNPKAGVASAHLNQKPLEFMRRILTSCTRPGDVLREPFGGLCSASVAAVELSRRSFAAEIDENFATLAASRIEEARALVSGMSCRAQPERRHIQSGSGQSTTVLATSTSLRTTSRTRNPPATMSRRPQGVAQAP